jgi:hypothetical protein
MHGRRRAPAYCHTAHAVRAGRYGGDPILCRRRPGALAAHAGALVAAAAVDGFVVVRMERHLIFGAALGTDNGMHLTWRPLSGSTRSSLLAAGGAASRLVEQSFQLIELLLSSGEDKRLATLTTLERFVLVHSLARPPEMPSSQTPAKPPRSMPVRFMCPLAWTAASERTLVSPE